VPYRDRVVKIDGRMEHFSVRVTDAAFAEWLGSRNRLRQQGFPDRPPDVDTPTIRAWVERPGEGGLPYFEQQREQEASGVFAILTMAWHAGDFMVKLYVTGFRDGSIHVDAFQSHQGIEIAHVGHQHGTEEDPDVVWADVEALIEMTDAKGWVEGEPRVTWLSDFQAIDDELELARAEAGVGFPVPAGPVQ
jgi:hypothetical protein